MNRVVERVIEKVINNYIWSVKGKTIPLGWSAMLNYQFELHICGL